MPLVSLFSNAIRYFTLTINLGGLGPAVPPPASVQKPETPQPVQKPPVPADHEILQRVFEDLKNRCNSAAGNPVSLLNKDWFYKCQSIPRITTRSQTIQILN